MPVAASLVIAPDRTPSTTAIIADTAEASILAGGAGSGSGLPGATLIGSAS